MLVYIVVQQNFLNENCIGSLIKGAYGTEIEAVKAVIKLADELHDLTMESYFEDHAENDIEPQLPVIRHGVYPMKLVVRGSTAIYSTVTYAEVDIDGSLLFE